MPQQSLLPEHPTMTGFGLTIRSYPHTKFSDEVDVSLAVATGDGPLKTRTVVSLRGLECDYLNTLVSEAASAYMYGEKPQDIVKAALDVRTLARQHAAAHGM